MLWIDQTVQFSVGCILSSTIENEQRERADIQFTFWLTIHFSTHNSLFHSQFTFRLTIHFSTQNSLFDSQFTLDRATSQHTLQQMATTEHIRGNVVHYQARNGAQSEAMTARGGQSFSLSLLTQFPLQQVNRDGHQDMKIQFSFLSYGSQKQKDSYSSCKI